MTERTSEISIKSSKLKKKLEAFRQVSGSAEEVDMEIKEKMQATDLAMAEMESLNQNLICQEA